MGSILAIVHRFFGKKIDLHPKLHYTITIKLFLLYFLLSCYLLISGCFCITLCDSCKYVGIKHGLLLASFVREVCFHDQRALLTN